MRVFEIGRVHGKDEPTVVLELNLEDLCWLQSLISSSNGFWLADAKLLRKELQGGIDFLEHRKVVLEGG